jgi:hypothetical protein
MGDRRILERGRKAPAAGVLQAPGGLADLADLLGGESDRSRRFLGGLIAGALVGAAVAGSTLLRRRRGGGGAG